MFHFICLSCHKEFPLNTLIWKCDCGGLLDIKSDVVFDKSKIDQNRSGLWRYKSFIPSINDETISFAEVPTPLDASSLAGRREVFFKHDYLFPSGSYKDRGNTVMVSWLKAMGIASVIEDSSGNAGASLAMYAARAGIKAKILVPEATSEPKLIQAKACGAEIVRVKGDRKATADQALMMAADTFYASHVYSPLFYHGTKTLAYELYEQTGAHLPDQILFPAGNGSLLLGLVTGFADLHRAGLIRQMPRLIAAQHEDYAPLYNAIHEVNAPFSGQKTIAEGIAISSPARLAQLIAVVKKHDVVVETVSEAEIVAALKIMLSKGYYIEPTSAVAVAAFLKQKDSFAAGDNTIIVLTGNGLKANDAIGKIIKT